MNLTENTQAILLLTAYFSKPVKGAVKPLTPTEWGRFALWLKENQRVPSSLLTIDSVDILDGWHDAKISKERITELLGRGHALALALEKWSRAGLWVLTRSDAAYPIRLKARLKTNAPPVLFGCGNASLLNTGGVAVVGSRNASPEDLAFTQGLGQRATSEGYAVVSGGARGVDEASMLAAMEAGGSVVGVLADSLLKAATSRKWRQGLMDNNLVLVSPFYPEAGFNAGNAMARNKYIYCLADTAVVVHSGTKGGTWNGALENLKKQWVPLWVKPTTDEQAGNAAIVQQGAAWCEGRIEEQHIAALFNANQPHDESQDLFSLPPKLSLIINSETTPEQSVAEETQSPALITTPATPSLAPMNFYTLFLLELKNITSYSPLEIEQICSQLGLQKNQVHEWLKQAISDQKVKKLAKPVRYQWEK